MMKIEGSGSESGYISQRHGLRIRIRIRMHTKMSWIRNTGFEACCKENLPCLISPGIPHTHQGNLSRHCTDKNSSVFIIYKASNVLVKCQIKNPKTWDLKRYKPKLFGEVLRKSKGKTSFFESLGVSLEKNIWTIRYFLLALQKVREEQNNWRFFVCFPFGVWIFTLTTLVTL